jgi:hypothetical protein
MPTFLCVNAGGWWLSIREMPVALVQDIEAVELCEFGSARHAMIVVPALAQHV